MLFRRELFVFLCSVIAFANPLPFTDNELECYAQEKVYHEPSGKCYKILTKGPCETGEWLVLEKPAKDDSDPRIRPICSKDKCGEGEYYWPSTQSCVDAKTRLCPPQEELLSNVFGDGECSCSRDPPRMRPNGDKKSPCHQLYTRGPCSVGQVLALSNNETTKPICTEDKCHEETIQRKKAGKLSKDGILAPFTNGSCYELGTQGPCGKEEIFKVHINFLKPSCISLTTTIFSLQRPQNCYQDENGDCQTRVTTNKRQDAEKYKVHSVSKQPECTSPLSHIFSGIKQCTVDENGDCQKEITNKKKGNKYLRELKEFLKNK